GFSGEIPEDSGILRGKVQGRRIFLFPQSHSQRLGGLKPVPLHLSQIQAASQKIQSAYRGLDFRLIINLTAAGFYAVLLKAFGDIFKEELQKLFFFSGKSASSGRLSVKSRRKLPFLLKKSHKV